MTFPCFLPTIRKETILKYSTGVDLLIIGVKRGKKTTKAIEESVSFLISEQAACSVLIVKSISKTGKPVSKL